MSRMFDFNIMILRRRNYYNIISQKFLVFIFYFSFLFTFFIYNDR